MKLKFTAKEMRERANLDGQTRFLSMRNDFKNCIEDINSKLLESRKIYGVGITIKKPSNDILDSIVMTLESSGYNVCVTPKTILINW